MKNKTFEISANTFNKILYIIGFLIFSFFMYWIIFLDNDKRTFQASSLNILNEEYKGYVINKDYDKSNHNSPMIYFKNDVKIAVFGEFWSQIEIGDSLVKKRGETIITVYKNNRIIILDNQDILKSFQKQ